MLELWHRDLEREEQHGDMNYAKHANAATLQHQFIGKHLGCVSGLNEALADQDPKAFLCRRPGTSRGRFCAPFPCPQELWGQQEAGAVALEGFFSLLGGANGIFLW